MKYLAPLAFTLLLGGCASTTDPVPPAAALPPAYFAIGTEPGWTLEITPKRLNFSGDYGAVRIVEPHRGVEARNDRRGFAGQRIAVTITRGPCSDGMSERRHAETVRLVVDGKPLNGCGGAVLPPANLMGSLWRFTHIGGGAVTDAARTELRFADGALSGSAGCNRFTGSYRITGNALTIGALTATELACTGAAGEQESRLLALMNGPVKIAYASDGGMTLTGMGGMTAKLLLRP